MRHDGQTMAHVVTTNLPNGGALEAAEAVRLNNGMKVIPAFSARVSLNEDWEERAEGLLRPLVHLRVAFHAPEARLVPYFVGLEADEVRGTSLREVRVLECLQFAARYAIYLPMEDNDDEYVSLVEAMIGSSESLTFGVRTNDEQGIHARDAGPKDWVLRNVAFTYQLAQLCSRPPAQAVASEFGIPARTASRWIARAKAEGHLIGLALEGHEPGDPASQLVLWELIAGLEKHPRGHDGVDQATP